MKRYPLADTGGGSGLVLMVFGAAELGEGDEERDRDLKMVQ